MERWPNFFIVGAPKAGTTSLYEYLKGIPGIYMSPVKEPRYFSATTLPKKHDLRPIRDKKKYLNLFKKAKDEKIIGEASPTYLADPAAPKLIHDMAPDARIVITLRDPVERLFSSYFHLLRYGARKMSFSDALKVELARRTDGTKVHIKLEDGLYSKNLRTYMDIFGQDQVKVLIFEEWVKNAKVAVEEILRFLGLNYSLDDFESEAYNAFLAVRGQIAQSVLTNRAIALIAKSIVPRSTRIFLKETFLFKREPKPTMDHESREILVQFYKDDVQKLETMLGRKLPWPNFQN